MVYSVPLDVVDRMLCDLEVSIAKEMERTGSAMSISLNSPDGSLVGRDIRSFERAKQDGTYSGASSLDGKEIAFWSDANPYVSKRLKSKPDRKDLGPGSLIARVMGLRTTTSRREELDPNITRTEDFALLTVKGDVAEVRVREMKGLANNPDVVTSVVERYAVLD